MIRATGPCTLCTRYTENERKRKKQTNKKIMLFISNALSPAPIVGRQAQGAFLANDIMETSFFFIERAERLNWNTSQNLCQAVPKSLPKLCQDYAQQKLAMRLPQFIYDIPSKFVKKTKPTEINAVLKGNRSRSLFHFCSFNTYSESQLSESWKVLVGYRTIRP